MTNSEARKRAQNSEHPPAGSPVLDGPSYGDYWPTADLPVAAGDAGTEDCPDCAAFRARPSGGEPNWTCFTCGRDHVEEPSSTPHVTSAAGSSPEDDGAREGTCATCGGVLVQVPGERTYHPAATSAPANPCPALLPIPGTKAVGFDVPDDRFIPGSSPEDAGERAGLSEDGLTPDVLAEWRRLATEGYQPRGNRAVWAQRCARLIDRLAAVEQQRDGWKREAVGNHQRHHDAEQARRDVAQERDEIEQEAAALREQVAAVAALLAEAEKLTSERPNYDFDGNRFKFPISQASLRAVLADPASVLAQRDAEVGAKALEEAAGDVDALWVGGNGNEHGIPYERSEEALIAWLRDRARGLRQGRA